MRVLFLYIIFTSISFAQQNQFKSIDELLTTANSVRLASGAPGPDYWQQKVDYKMEIELDEDKKTATFKKDFLNTSSFQ